jgi:hypothetical protein
MLISKLDTRATAGCPVCKVTREMYVLGGDLLYSGHMDLRCETCKTEFRRCMDGGDEILKRAPKGDIP